MCGSRLEGRIAIVTGGSRGIGRAIVKNLAAEGAVVRFTFFKDETAATEVMKECQSARGIQCDGRDRKAVENVLKSILDESGHVDILVNNAGITTSGLFAMMNFQDWNKVMETNVNGSYHWAKAVFRPMLARKSGSILNMASVSGLFGLPGQTAYASSKGAIVAFTRALAAEGGGKGIRVNCLVPGFIDTDMTAGIPSPVKRQYKERIIMRRFGTPEEVARVATFLVSDEASYITGQTLVVDGGLSSGMT